MNGSIDNPGDIVVHLTESNFTLSGSYLISGDIQIEERGIYDIETNIHDT